MIVQLRGFLIRKDINSLVLDVAGVGYGIQSTLETLNSLEVGQEVLLEVSQVFREDDVSLFGFKTLEERELFELLCSVNGVGPKSALAIINRLGVNGVQLAVAEADDEMFKSVSGIGPKTAKLIVLSLTGKLVIDESSATSRTEANVIAALIGLGFQDRAVRQVLTELAPSNSETPEAELLKLALAKLAKSRRIEANE